MLFCHFQALRYSVHFKPFIILLFLVVTALPALATETKPVVLTTVKPLSLVLHLLAGDLLETQTLLSEGHSPHEVSLSFRQRRQLRDADAIVWLGPHFEHYLEKPLSTLDGGLKLQLNERNAGHSWLDPKAMSAVGFQLHKLSLQLLPSWHSVLEERHAAFQESVLTLDAELAKILAPLRGQAVFSGHGGIQPLLKRYDIRLAGMIKSAQHSGISLRQARLLRAQVEQGQVSCVVLEHSGREHKLATMFEGLPVHIVELDLLASNASNYFDFMRELATKLRRCSEPSSAG